MLVVPAATPVTMPVEAPTEAMPGAALVHVPPDTGSVSVNVEPTQMLPAPTMAVGTELTVTTCDIRHPVGMVYVTVSVPVDRPENTPVVLMDPTAGVVCVQVPPGVASVSVVVRPTHTIAEPPIMAGSGLTVTGLVVKQLVPSV